MLLVVFVNNVNDLLQHNDRELHFYAEVAVVVVHRPHRIPHHHHIVYLRRVLRLARREKSGK